MNATDTHHINVLLEEIRDQNKVVLEAVSGIRVELAQVLKRTEFEEIKQGVKVIKAAVTDLSRQVNDHEYRVSRIETE